MRSGTGYRIFRKICRRKEKNGPAKIPRPNFWGHGDGATEEAMMRKEDRFRDAPFPSLKLGVAAALLLAGMLPVVAGLALAGHLAGREAARETERHLAALHGMMVQALELAVERLDDAAGRMAADPAVRTLAEGGGSGGAAVPAADPDSLDIMQALFAGLLSERLPVTGVCLSAEAAGLTVCSDRSALYASGSAAGGAARLEAHESGGETFIRFVKPLAEPGRGPAAALVFLLDERALLNPGKWPALKAHSLTDPSGRTTLGTPGGLPPAAKAAGGRDIIVTTASASLLSERWRSVAVWEAAPAAGLSRALLEAGLWAGLVALTLAAGAYALFHAAVSRPLLALRALMKRAESGDLRAYWTMRAAGEIGRLGDSYNQMLNRIDELIRRVKTEEALKKEKELEALHYQLNPHFLYNTLNTIKWVAKIHRTPQIADAVSALVRLLQASLGKKGDFLTLREEIGLVRDYMAIQAFRYGDAIELCEETETLTLPCLVPKLILQPLVENAVIHGLQRKEGEKKVTIRSWLERDMMFIEVEDNGVGMEGEPAERSGEDRRLSPVERMSGIGLNHIREKLRLYYGPDYPMRIFSKPGEGTRVRLALPIHRMDD